MGRPNYVKILVDGNADQSTKNLKGENILHAALTGTPSAHRLRPLLDHLDADLRSHLFQQRKNLSDNGLTPLHFWIFLACAASPESFDQQPSRYSYNNFHSAAKPYRDERGVVAMLELLLKYSGGSELEMFNGGGDTPLHTAVMHNMPSIVRILIKHNPRLLHRENAVGRTPAELAHDRFIGNHLKEHDGSGRARAHDGTATALLGRDVSSFVKKSGEEEKTAEQAHSLLKELGLSGEYLLESLGPILIALGREADTDDRLSPKELMGVVWDLCKSCSDHHPEKRRLVSLNEANDVARRLGESYTSSRYFSAQARAEDDDNDEAQENTGRKETHDFAATKLQSNAQLAWKVFEAEAKASGWEKCEECGWYHE